ncbi:MAG: agmatinase [Peptococcaceae bacterium BRH_c4b]|nr:MAG: agmatinase [Peptococcaceae bacterium BRH_c4b]
MGLERFNGFMGSSPDYGKADIVIMGAPMDITVSFRPGARFGPHHIRLVSVGLEEYSPVAERDLSDYVYHDLGDVEIVPGRVEKNLEYIAEAMDGVLSDRKFPVLLGGEHLVTLPAVEKAASHYPGLVVVQLDAHADLRDEYLGEKLSHATVMRRVAEVVGGRNIFQCGIRSGAREEFRFAREETNLYHEVNGENIENIIAGVAGRPVYLTLDIDVVDPAYASGTGTPEPGGCSAKEILQALHMLARLPVVGFDLVEVCPVYDPGESTSLLAAKLIREAILLFGHNFIAGHSTTA